jgi:hypothetical protein
MVEIAGMIAADRSGGGEGLGEDEVVGEFCTIT